MSFLLRLQAGYSRFISVGQAIPVLKLMISIESISFEYDLEKIPISERFIAEYKWRKMEEHSWSRWLFSNFQFRENKKIGIRDTISKWCDLY